MLINSYNNVYQQYFLNSEVSEQIQEAISLIITSKRVFFIGNGGSNSICSHMMEDFAKVARIQAFSFTDAALITCLSNDYGYENAMAEWLKVYLAQEDILVSISSSGNSANILNATTYANSIGSKTITLSGFSPENKLKQLGNLNFHIPSDSYGIVECFHQVILHAVLDEMVYGNS